MDKRFLGILAALVIIFVGIFAITQGGSKNNNSTGASGPPTSHIEGKGTTGVKLVEYGDYECPVCALYNPTVDQVEAKYSNQIYYQFRNLPLTEIHRNAFAAARAAEAAALQGKYWQMHQKLYDNQDQWANAPDPTSNFNQYAQNLGLNVAQFKRDYGSSTVNDAINADVAAFNKTGQQKATPTFFLDGKYIDNSQLIDQSGQPSVAKFSALIDKAIAKH